LVAHGRDIEQIRQLIGCDALIYQDVEGMRRAVGALSSALSDFDASCFDGRYITGDVTPDSIDALNQGRNPAQVQDEEAPGSRLTLPNAQHE
ncbi:MAG: amidophosphoribosyltransferase, partial [Comamonadaceae bacterium]|nr:amidophosphoribosyltransferase [Comamonadaceae bacterium]